MPPVANGLSKNVTGPRCERDRVRCDDEPVSGRRSPSGTSAIERPTACPKRLATAFAFTLVCLAIGCGPSGTETGSTPTIDAGSASTPERLISLAPSLTETVFALGAGDRLVGVTQHCHYPPAADELPEVGAYLDTDFEAILKLRPDLVLLLPDFDRQAFETLGLETLVVDQTRVPRIADAFRQIGRACGVAQAGDDLAHELEQRFETARRRWTGAATLRVLIIIEREFGSAPESVLIAGRDNFYQDILSALSAENAFPNSQPAYPTLSAEALLRLDPDVLLEIVPQRRLEQIGRTVADLVDDWDQLGELSAVANGNVHVLTEDYAVLPGPRVGLLLDRFERALRPGSEVGSP